MISTWEELLESDVALRDTDVSSKTVTAQFGLIRKSFDGRIRLEIGVEVFSEIKVVDGERMIEVLEGSMTPAEPYVTSRVFLTYFRSVESLCLIESRPTSRMYSVLVPIEKLDQIQFTDEPDISPTESLSYWSRQSTAKLIQQAEAQVSKGSRSVCPPSPLTATQRLSDYDK